MAELQLREDREHPHVRADIDHNGAFSQGNAVIEVDLTLEYFLEEKGRLLRREKVVTIQPHTIRERDQSRCVA